MKIGEGGGSCLTAEMCNFKRCLVIKKEHFSGRVSQHFFQLVVVHLYHLKFSFSSMLVSGYIRTFSVKISC